MNPNKAFLHLEGISVTGMILQSWTCVPKHQMVIGFGLSRGREAELGWDCPLLLRAVTKDSSEDLLPEDERMSASASVTVHPLSFLDPFVLHDQFWDQFL